MSITSASFSSEPSRIWLLLAGEYSSNHPPIGAKDTIIAVDKGIEHAQRLGLLAHVWLGDFDSTSDISRYIDIVPTVLRFPVNKDKTDFELALTHINNHYQNVEIHVLGSEGGEADHAFGNLWTLPQSCYPVILWQHHSVVVSLKGGCVQFNAVVGQKVSVFALSTLYNVSSQGLRWHLSHAQIAQFSSYAMRNEIVHNPVKICWQSGHALIFLPIKATISLFLPCCNT